METLALALSLGGRSGMSASEATQLCTTLRSMASTICDSLTKRLQSQLGEPGSGDRSLDKSGEQVQAEAVQLCCLMTGRGGGPEVRGSSARLPCSSGNRGPEMAFGNTEERLSQFGNKRQILNAIREHYLMKREADHGSQLFWDRIF